MKKNYPTIILIFVFLFLSCSSRPDLEKAEKEILDVLKQERKAHFEKKADLFMSEFSDSMISVNNGVLMTASKDERRKRIQGYFNRVEFIKWDDVAKPLIRFSDDGSLAYAIIQKQVILLVSDGTGLKKRDTTDFAWVSIYRKQGNEWKVECNISTRKEKG